MVYLCLYTFTIFCSFPITIGDNSQRTAVEIYQLVTDGEQFVKRIVHGEKISDNPGYLLFTAPYKLCEGGCKEGESNFAMAFPIYVGKKGKEKYKELYERDSHKIHYAKPDAPFKTKPTKKLFTLCPSEVTLEQTTVTPTETPMNTETETLLTETLTTDAASVEPEYESTNPETEKTAALNTPTETSTETPSTETPTVPETESTNSKTKAIAVSETEAIVSEIDTTSSEIKATEIPSSENQTLSDTETTMTETPTVTYTIEIPTSLNVKTTPITNTLTVSATELTVIETPTKVFTAKTSTISKTAMPTTDTPKTDAPTTILAKTIITEVPVAPETDLTTIKGTSTMSKTESRETIQQSETNLPEFTESQVTETEDITFEDYTDTTDALNAENEESDYVTNANGVRCPPRICQKKTKVTPKIITLIPYNKRAGKLDTRYAQWDSEYSDFRDSYSY